MKTKPEIVQWVRRFGYPVVVFNQLTDGIILSEITATLICEQKNVFSRFVSKDDPSKNVDLVKRVLEASGLFNEAFKSAKYQPDAIGIQYLFSVLMATSNT